MYLDRKFLIVNDSSKDNKSSFMPVMLIKSHVYNLENDDLGLSLKLHGSSENT